MGPPQPPTHPSVLVTVSVLARRQPGVPTEPVLPRQAVTALGLPCRSWECIGLLRAWPLSELWRGSHDLLAFTSPHGGDTVTGTLRSLGRGVGAGNLGEEEGAPGLGAQ